MSALIGLLALALFLIFLVIGIVDLLRKKPAKRNLLISLISLVVFFAMMAIPTDNSSDNKNTADNAGQAETKASTDKKDSNKPSSGVTGVEPAKVSDPIKNFVYEIDGDKVKIKEYQGTSKVAEIAPSYTIDGKTYQTELDDCFRGAKTVIFDEGITTIPNAFFNTADVEKVYFPKSMTLVYDDTLAYMDVDDGKKYKIYYAGSQEEWNHIFQHYVAKDPSDLPLGEEKGKALADKVNRLIGHEYNSENFEYFFNADPNDAR